MTTHIHIPVGSANGSTYCAECGKLLTPPKTTRPPRDKKAGGKAG